MPKKNKDYWQQRFDQIEQSANNRSTKYVKQLEKKYQIAAQQIDGQINAWYQRIAANNEVSMTEARKLLSSSELKEFKWTVEDYIKYGQENEIDQRWMKELENASAKFHINKLEALKLEVRQQVEQLFAGGQQSMYDVLADVYSDTFYRSCFEIQKGVGIGFDVAKLDDGKVSRILSRPWSVDGTNFSEKLWGNKVKLINNLDQEISRMVLTGESPRKAIANIKKEMGSSLASAKRLVMTEQAFFTSTAQANAYGELDVEEYEFVGTFDGRTCGDCGDLDGKHFPVAEMAVGINAPPMHPYCRCTTCPYFDDEFTIDDKRAAKDEECNWYEVPANMTYKEWKNNFVDGGSKDGLAKMAIDKTNGTNYNVVRTADELQAVAQSVKADISNYADNESKWTGNINIDNSLKLDGINGQIEWNGDITVVDTADDGTMWHEMLHTCSVSYYDEVTYITHRNIEEASVEFLKQQICSEKGITSASAYEELTVVLQTLNSSFNYGTDMEFAKELFNVALPDRYQWLEDKVDDTLRKMNVSFEDYNDIIGFIGVLKGGL